MSPALPIANAFVTAEAQPGNLVRERVLSGRSGATILVERASAARLDEIGADWRGLVARAHEPNVFMNPAIAHLMADNCVALLAWSGERKLTGVWVFSIAHRWLARALQSPAFPHAYLATPVVDRDDPRGVLAAMLDFIANDADLPKLVVLNPIKSDGPTMHALAQVLVERRTPLFTLSESQRPVLQSELDGKQYFEKAMSGSSRKKLRQHRRRLDEKGGLESRVAVASDAVRGAFEDFLTLEAAGWKGRAGSALLSRAADAQFARKMIAALAERGDASVHALYQQDRPVAAQIILRAERVAFTWKTTYDETLAEFSPGMLLLEDYTTAFLADRSIALVDSCALDDSGFMSAWSERETIANMMFDARQGGSVTSITHALMQKTALTLRALAKAAYLAGRRRWKGR